MGRAVGVAAVERAGVVVVDGGGASAVAVALAVADLRATAAIVAGSAQRPLCDGVVPHAEQRIAAIRGARILIVDDRCHTRATGALRVASLASVAHRGVVT